MKEALRQMEREGRHHDRDAIVGDHGRTFGVPGIPYPEPGWAGEAGVATAGSPGFPGTPVDGRVFGKHIPLSEILSETCNPMCGTKEVCDGGHCVKGVPDAGASPGGSLSHQGSQRTRKKRRRRRRRFGKGGSPQFAINCIPSCGKGSYCYKGACVANPDAPASMGVKAAPQPAKPGRRRRRRGGDVIASDHGRVIGGRRMGVPGIPYPEPGWAGEGGVATAGSPRFPGTPIPRRKKWGP